jgi:monoterpene epsilon-lactone hydrolase
MKNLRRHLIHLFLRTQKLLQRNASIDLVRRLSRWSEKLYSIPKDVHWEKFIRNEQAYEWLIPNEINSDYVLFYIHGGFVSPLYNPTRYLAGYLARMTGMRALLVEFRLAPEHPYPAAIEDCVTAYHWLISEGGFLPKQVIFVGESAGGNLAITTMLSLRDARNPLPRGAVLISPVVDFEGTGSFFTQNDPMADADFVMRQLNAYRGGADPHNPLISPIQADLQDLPPLFIQVGAKEILLSGVEVFALRAKKAGVPTILEIWPEMWHYWHIFVPSLPEAQQAMQSINDFLQSCQKKEPETG